MRQLFYNGKIHLMDQKRTVVEAMLVEKGRVTLSGSNIKMKAAAGPNCPSTDLNGATVVPGFNDSHLHLMGIGMAQEQVFLADTHSIEDLIEQTRNFMKNNPEQKWILGRGWNQSNYPNQELPLRHDLDRISTSLPVFLRRTCGHVAVANTKALEMAGLMQKNPPQPAGGHIDLDENGLPTGILRETASTAIFNIIPKFTHEDYVRHIQKGAALAISYGLTSVQSDDLGSQPSMERKLQAYQDAFNKGLKLRVNHQIRLATTAEIDEFLILREKYSFPEHTVTYGPLKLMTDGSLGGRTALMHAPYTDDPSTSGLSIMSQEEIDEMFIHAHRHGLQMSAHAIGDLAIQKLLNGFRAALNGDKTARPRVIHAQITNWHILEQMQDLGVVCDIQPAFVPTDMKIVVERLGWARSKQSYLWKTMREMGIPTAGGSDSPVENCNPILGISAAVLRTDQSGVFPEGFLPEEKLTVDEAIDLFTNGSAYSERTESDKGNLSDGKLADFVVLSKDIFSVPEEEIRNIKVVATYIGGEEVYRAKD